MTPRQLRDAANGPWEGEEANGIRRAVTDMGAKTGRFPGPGEYHFPSDCPSVSWEAFKAGQRSCPYCLRHR